MLSYSAVQIVGKVCNIPVGPAVLAKIVLRVSYCSGVGGGVVQVAEEVK